MICTHPNCTKEAKDGYTKCGKHVWGQGKPSCQFCGDEKRLPIANSDEFGDCPNCTGD